MLRRSCQSLATPPPSAGPQHYPPRNIIGPFASRPASILGAVQPHEQAAPGGVGNVAPQPVAAGAASIAEIVAANRLGLRGETAREIGGGEHHGGAPQYAGRAAAR